MQSISGSGASLLVIDHICISLKNDQSFHIFSYLKLDSSVVTSCIKTNGKLKVVIF